MTTIFIYIALLALTALYSYEMGVNHTQKKYYDLKIKQHTKKPNETTVEKRHA